MNYLWWLLIPHNVQVHRPVPTWIILIHLLMHLPLIIALPVKHLFNFLTMLTVGYNIYFQVPRNYDKLEGKAVGWPRCERFAWDNLFYAFNLGGLVTHTLSSHLLQAHLLWVDAAPFGASLFDFIILVPCLPSLKLYHFFALHWGSAHGSMTLLCSPEMIESHNLLCFNLV